MPPTELAQEIGHTLNRQLRGQIRLDSLSRHLYSTDASNYTIKPLGVVIPWDAADVSATMEMVNQHDLSVIPRGGGTSLSGQTVGAGLVVDYSRYINKIINLNPAEKEVTVESGVVLAQLNRALAPHGLMVGPDPSSAPVATIGGMTANNSTGTHSIEYGLMVDHVKEVTAILADGTLTTFGPKSQTEVYTLAMRNTLEGRLYRYIPALLTEYETNLRRNYPHTWRNVAGYNLNRLLANRDAGYPLNIAPLIVGSEGTLANIISVTLNVVERPHLTRLAMIHFDELQPCLEAVPLILEHQPSAVELIDRFNIRLTQQHPQFAPLQEEFIDGDPRGVLMVEFKGDNPADLEHRVAELKWHLNRSGHRGQMIHCITPQEIDNVWAIRKAGFGLMMSMRGDAKALSFADDATVPVESLPNYATIIERIMTEEGIECSFFGHVSAGCMHLNPVINLKTAEGLRRMEKLSRVITAAALHFNGTSSGEHGEGLARSYYNKQVYGTRLYQAFTQLKALFDPQNRLNPGKIVDGVEPWQPELLRINPDYQTPFAPVQTFFDFSEDGGMAGLVEMCNGQGLCRKGDAGVMCPSFRATREEAYSTRGRANALRAAMTGQLDEHGLHSPLLHEAMDLCLGCKACQNECPSLVDMAKLKHELLAHYQAEHGVSWRTKLFAHVATLTRLARVAPSFVNRTMNNRLLRFLLDAGLGIDKQRPLPSLAPMTFQQEMRRHQATTDAPNGQVVLWDDTYLSQFEPEIGLAAVRLLEAAGFAVTLIKNHRCCGRPMISMGLLAEAKENAAHNVSRLFPYANRGIPIIGLEPSCITTFYDEYPNLLGTDSARIVAQQSQSLETFLAKLHQAKKLALTFQAPPTPRQVLLHGHCHQKASTGTEPLLTLLGLLPNTTVEEIDSGCCGMAGAFGYEKEHYQLSMACGEDRLFPAVRAAPVDTVLLSSGFSCRHQIEDGVGRQVIHPILFLASYI